MSEPKLPDVMLTLLQNIHDDVKRMDERLESHIDEEEELMERHTAEIVALQAAFPRGDMAGHQLYHASIIQRNDWISQVCKDITKEIAKYGLIGALGWLAYHAWVDFLAGPGK